jgi:uracil-DNA glycosylase family 4
MPKLNLIYDINYDKEKLFNKLVDSIENCRLCTQMECRTKVFSEFNGNIYSNVLFIAEAPGRLGADKTKIPLFGDQTGVNFQRLIDNIGWTRDSFFITNAILCNPRDVNGNNAPPSKQEIENCSIYLNILIEIMKPEYIITLGQKALDALNYICKINVKLKDDVRKIVDWNGFKLIPLYHTGPRALVHRNYYNQLADFYWVQRNVKIKAEPWLRIEKSNLTNKIKKAKKTQSKLQKLIFEVLSKVDRISEFKLTKLIYLIDYESLVSRGKLITNSFYIRSYNGPIPVGLNNELSELLDVAIITRSRAGYKLNVDYLSTIIDEEAKIISSVIEKYKDYKDSQLKTVTYLTKPMKRILKFEKQGGSMIHKPVFSKEDFYLSNDLL